LDTSPFSTDSKKTLIASLPCLKKSLGHVSPAKMEPLVVWIIYITGDYPFTG